MLQISSAANTRLKALQALIEEPRMRRVERCAVWEGIHLVEVAIQQNLPVQSIWFAESAMVHAEISDLFNQINVDKIQLTDALWRRVSSIHAEVGVLAVVSIPLLNQEPVLVENTLVLERIQDPGNLGTILRTAAAVGVHTILCTHGCADVWSPKVLRAGMGAHAFLEIYEQIAEAELCRLLSNTALQVLVTCLRSSTSLFEHRLPEVGIWVFGNEGEGVSSVLQEMATHRVCIPQPGQVESLNVSVAAAICLYEQLRQHPPPIKIVQS